MEADDKHSPFLESVRSTIPVPNDRDATEQAYLALNAPFQRHAVQSRPGVTLRLNSGAVREQAASRDPDTPKRAPPDDEPLAGAFPERW